jgi:hypothetical protein
VTRLALHAIYLPWLLKSNAATEIKMTRFHFQFYSFKTLTLGRGFYSYRKVCEKDIDECVYILFKYRLIKLHTILFCAYNMCLHNELRCYPHNRPWRLIGF